MVEEEEVALVDGGQGFESDMDVRGAWKWFVCLRNDNTLGGVWPDIVIMYWMTRDCSATSKK